MRAIKQFVTFENSGNKRNVLLKAVLHFKLIAL